MTKQQREDYEKSRLSYLGFKQATETAKKDGIEQGKIEAVLGLSKNGVSIAIIAKSLNLSEDRVNEILKNYSTKVLLAR